MPLVSKPSAFACRAERLTRTRTCPHGPVIGPAGESKRVGPPAHTGEEMAAGIPGKVAGQDVSDVAFIDMAFRQHSGGNEIAQPCRGIRVNFVVVMHGNDG